MFRCNLPPARLTEWSGSFTCHCGNMGVERTLNKSQHTKLTLEKKILPPLLLKFRLTTFWSRVRHSSQQAIPAIAVDYNTPPRHWIHTLSCLVTGYFLLITIWVIVLWAVFFLCLFCVLQNCKRVITVGMETSRLGTWSYPGPVSILSLAVLKLPHHPWCSGARRPLYLCRLWLWLKRGFLSRILGGRQS